MPNGQSPIEPATPGFSVPVPHAETLKNKGFREAHEGFCTPICIKLWITVKVRFREQQLPVSFEQFVVSRLI
jgi:hypothetical protein